VGFAARPENDETFPRLPNTSGVNSSQGAAMHFGLHLKKKGIISAEELVAALELQQESLVPIGQLALEEGILSARDIFEILRAQSESPSERFGELAIEMGLLTRDELTSLLMIQADRRRPIGDILVEQGVLGERQLAVELAAYREAQLRPRQPRVKVIPASRIQKRPPAMTEGVTAV
jgi:hypothetical protein